MLNVNYLNLKATLGEGNCLLRTESIGKDVTNKHVRNRYSTNNIWLFTDPMEPRGWIF